MSNLPDDLERQLKMIKEAQESVKAYNDLLEETRELYKNIEYIQSHVNELSKEKEELEKKLLNATGQSQILLRKQIAVKELGIKMAKDELELAEKEYNLRSEALKQIKLRNLYAKEGVNLAKALGERVLTATGYFLEQQKSVKQTELSMGILSNQAKGFRNNIYTTSITTNEIGVNTKELAELQGTYADNLGRSVQLNEEQLTAIAQIGKGTLLGTEASAELAANFEKIGISAKGTQMFIEDSLKMATKMGTSASKTIKNIQKNLSLVNRYNFQGGVAGFSKMAALATKFNIEMESIARVADNLMTPEGAVEVASRLQVLGGEWSKLGNPFELMFKSRNDLAGLTEDIINATKATATFDKSTGEFTISPLELSRLREVASVTGQNAEELAEMAKQSAKLDKVSSMIPSTFNKEDREYLATLATFDSKTGKYKITLQTEDKTITDNVDSLTKITPAMVKSQRDFVRTLEDRAKDSMTFNERFNRLLESFQSSFLPAFEVIADLLEKSLNYITPLVRDVSNFISEWPKTFATIGAALSGVALLGDRAMWFMRGQWLAGGFNSMTGGFGGGLSSKKMIQGRNIARYGKVGGRMMNVGRGLGRFAAPLTIASAGIDAISNLGNENLSTGDALLKTLDENKFMALGATIGSIIPGLGTLAGAGIGGLIDWASQMGDDPNSGLIGDYNNSSPSKQMNDFISRPGDKAIPFSSQDTIVGAKTGGPLDRMLNSVTNNQVNNYLPGNDISVKFGEPIKIEGKIEVNSDDNSKEIDLNDPILMQNLSRMIMEELTKAISGGKISSNPVLA